MTTAKPASKGTARTTRTVAQAAQTEPQSPATDETISFTMVPVAEMPAQTRNRVSKFDPIVAAAVAGRDNGTGPSFVISKDDAQTTRSGLYRAGKSQNVSIRIRETAVDSDATKVRFYVTAHELIKRPRKAKTGDANAAKTGDANAAK